MKLASLRSIGNRTAISLVTAAPMCAAAQVFDRISATITSVQTLMLTISVAVVTSAVIWAGFKVIFQGARLSEVPNVLVGGAIVGGAGAIATFIATFIAT